MTTVYMVRPDHALIPMKRQQVADETEELHELLEKNLHLLPGDQINPDDPRRWLIVKREMPVADPASSQPRWSLDFFLLDQSAVPTFVECKRFADTRSRREVVGQMLEYAANAHHYWTRETLRDLATQSALERNQSLDQAIVDLRPDDDMDVDEFFERAVSNLHEGRIRLVFLLDEAPAELKSIVDFLSRQMERTEVLLVEARFYKCEETTIVVPLLFGYVERETPAPATGAWSEQRFFGAAESNLKENHVQLLRDFYERLQQQVASRAGELQIVWGGGKRHGSLNVKALWICPRSIYTVWEDGHITLNFGWLYGNETAEQFRDSLRDALVTRLGWNIRPDYQSKFVNITADQWLAQAIPFLEVLDELFAKPAMPET